jgi:long-chain acyl-CoA synthetase
MQIKPDDVCISYLPLSHCFERYMMVLCMSTSICYGFYQGDVLKLREDLAILKPTIMVSVPRLMNRFADMIKALINQE